MSNSQLNTDLPYMFISVVKLPVLFIVQGLIWAFQPNGDIFAFTPDRQTCVCIESPKKKQKSVMFICMSVCFDALWGLTDIGEVYIRTGMSSLEPRGSDWALLDLSQLGTCKNK